MKHEMKICFPLYKVAYAICFVAILSLVRGVTYTNEIGIALEAPMAILTISFCADTYTQEISGKRSEIQRLWPMKKRMYAIYRRVVIQELFLLLAAAAGYGFFFLFQKPRAAIMGQGVPESEIVRFLVYLAAIAVTLCFWGLLSNLFSCLFRNMWLGIGGCLVLWLVTNSSIGDRCFGAWNLFSYTFRELENSSDFSWLCGKMLCICMGILAVLALPKVIEERG